VRVLALAEVLLRVGFDILLGKLAGFMFDFPGVLGDDGVIE
jgi:hypothetical protein